VPGDHRDLHSFPTRRSSDLLTIIDEVGDVFAGLVPADFEAMGHPALLEGGNGSLTNIRRVARSIFRVRKAPRRAVRSSHRAGGRSEEHTSELQSRENLVCRL